MTENTNAPVQEEQSLSELLQIRRDKLKELQDAGMDPFQQTKYSVTAHSQEIKDNFETMEGQTVSVAGRLMSKRGMGKAVFCDLQDVQGRIQLYVRIGGARSPSRPIRSPSSPSPSGPCPRSSTA